MRTFISLLALGVLGLSPAAQAADTFSLFKAKASLAVSQVIPGAGGDPDKVVAKTLSANDLINLTMARPLGTKIDANAEALVLAVVIEGPGVVAAPKTKLVVVDPDPAVTGPGKILATLATLANLDFDIITPTGVTKGQGTGSAAIPETTTGVDPVNNKFFASTLTGAAVAKAIPSVTPQQVDGFSIALTRISGPLHFKFTTTKSPTVVDFDGMVLKGTFSTTGKPIAFLTL